MFVSRCRREAFFPIPLVLLLLWQFFVRMVTFFGVPDLQLLVEALRSSWD